MSTLEPDVLLSQTDWLRGLARGLLRDPEQADDAVQEVVARALERPPLVSGATYSHYVPRLTHPDALVRKMADDGVELGRLIDYCIPDMPAYRAYRMEGSSFPRTHKLNREVVNLPLHVTTGEASRIAGAVRRHLTA